MKKNCRMSLIICSAFIFLISCSTSKEKTSWYKVYTDQGLMVVNSDSASIKVNLRYSTTDNFIGKDVYGDLEEAYLQPEALSKLYKAAEYLNGLHPELRLLIWDAARPRRIQQVLWDQVEIPLPFIIMALR